MLREWLRPSIEKRVIEISDLSEQTQNIIQFRRKLNECFDVLIKHSNQNDQESLFELEGTLNIMLNSYIEIAYIEGLTDGIKVTQKLHNILSA